MAIFNGFQRLSVEVGLKNPNRNLQHHFGPVWNIGAETSLMLNTPWFRGSGGFKFILGVCKHLIKLEIYAFDQIEIATDG